jgi:NAD(P)H-flavin reductase
MVPDLYRVAKTRREMKDVFTLELEPPRGATPFAFAPGQFNMLYLFGVGEVPISLSGDASSPLPIVHTIRSVGAVSRGLCGVRRGDVVGVRGPFGSAWPVAEAEGADVLVVAGGIGLAPLRPAIQHLVTHRQAYGRVAILYGSRSPAELLFRRQIERWRGRFDLEVHVTVDHATEGWMGRVGVVTRLIRVAAFDPENTVAMVCGPEIMMRFTVRELQTLGVPDEGIYVSMERNMKCGVGLCGHCQLGPHFVCKDGPVFPFARIAPLLPVREG